MSQENFWGSEDQVSELDLVEEAQEAEELAAQYALEPTIVEAEEEELQAINEEAAYDLDNEEANVIYNARIRLEQAKLYELLINHNIFEGVVADPHAVHIVSNELKNYIVKRLEILMGLRQPVIQQQAGMGHLNEVEVDFLKQLAYKGTMGRSSTVEPTRVAAPVTGGLRPLAAPAPTAKPKAIAPQATPPAPQRRPKQTPNQPLPSRGRGGKKTKTSTAQQKAKVASPLNKRDLRQDEIDAIARAELEATQGKKPFSKMSKAEKKREMERRAALQENKPAPQTNRIPMASADQMQGVYGAQQARRSDATGLVGGGTGGGFNSIMANIAQKIAVEKSGKGE